MPHRQSHLVDQVIVITGASSGIGLLTARRAAARGAAVVVASRDAASLAVIAAEIENAGGAALAVVADVTSEADVERIVLMARERFGRIDTWVNNAGVAAYSTLIDLPIAEHRKIFETNYWGLVHGTLAAVRHFRSRPGAGTIINVGSVNSDVAIPLLSAYSASKHAVKGFNDALRRELLASDPNIRITLIKPSGIASGFRSTPATTSKTSRASFLRFTPPRSSRTQSWTPPCGRSARSSSEPSGLSWRYPWRCSRV